MALGRYVITQTTTVPAGAAATPTPGEPGTGGAAGYGSAAVTGGQLWATTFLKGTAILLDPAGPLYAAIGAGNLRAFTEGTDTVSHAALAN
jgi:hypothetical protein